MRSLLVFAAATFVAAATSVPSQAAVKEVAYPPVKIELPDTYKPDAAFQKMQKAFADAVEKKDAKALLALVGPTFVWMSGGELADQFDFGGDALQNFKVVFGFREYRKQTDGGVSDGPYWNTLADLAGEHNFEQSTETLVCGPAEATISDEDAFESVKQKIGADDSVDWYFTMTDTTATASPTGGAQVGKIGPLALPVLDAYPPTPAGGDAPPTTHLKVLLPSGKSGWIPIAAALPLSSNRMCYAHMPNGDWKFAGFDEAP